MHVRGEQHELRLLRPQRGVWRVREHELPLDVLAASRRAVPHDTSEPRVGMRERGSLLFLWEVRNTCGDDGHVHDRSLEAQHGTL